MNKKSYIRCLLKRLIFLSFSCCALFIAQLNGNQVSQSREIHGTDDLDSKAQQGHQLDKEIENSEEGRRWFLSARTHQSGESESNYLIRAWEKVQQARARRWGTSFSPGDPIPGRISANIKGGETFSVEEGTSGQSIMSWTALGP